MASISRRPDGVWRARYRDENGKERSRHFGRKVDAQRWLDEVTTAILTGLYADPRAGRVTFASYYEGWATRQVWVRSTRFSFNRAVKTTSFGELPIRSIRPSHVEAWVQEQVAGGLAASTIGVRFQQVRSVFRAAVRDKVIAIDPCAGVRLPRKRKAEAAMAVPPPEQVAVLLGVRTPFRAFMALCAFAGLRKGEAAGVQVRDVDFLRRTLTVSRQLQRADGGGMEVMPPKYGSERAVFLPERLVAILSDHVARWCPGDDPGRWLFSDHGTPWHDNRVTYLWRRAAGGADVSGVTLHDLRHFYASGLIASGCDVVTVQRALGHASASTTLNTYAHLWPSAEGRTRAAASSLMVEVLGLSADSVRTSAGSSGSD